MVRFVVEQFRRAWRERLTARERQVTALVARGWSNRSIGGRLQIGEKTVEKHVSASFKKLGLHTRTELAFRAVAAFGGAPPL